MDILKEITNVIKLEKSTLESVLSCIDKEYEKAVKLIYNTKGKVILTGIGKSGIIAQKIAATLVSTGTLAIYMHPSEGMHGDLGIVKKNDVVIAIGKSGESNEITEILPSLKKLGANIISITTNKQSTLAKYSDIVLYTKVDREACPLNLAPTCSTTAALAVGDAIAITLMKMRGFKKKDFALYHPGGRLGKRLLLKVQDIMRSGDRNPVVYINDTVKNMIFKITEMMSGAVSIIDKDGKLKGLVTDYDIRKVIEKGENIFDKKISEIMNPSPICISKEMKAIKALEIMENRERPILVLPVIDRNKRVVGMIHIHDILAKGL